MKNNNICFKTSVCLKINIHTLGMTTMILPAQARLKYFRVENEFKRESNRDLLHGSPVCKLWVLQYQSA